MQHMSGRGAWRPHIASPSYTAVLWNSKKLCNCLQHMFPLGRNPKSAQGSPTTGGWAKIPAAPEPRYAAVPKTHGTVVTADAPPDDLRLRGICSPPWAKVARSFAVQVISRTLTCPRRASCSGSAAPTGRACRSSTNCATAARNTSCEAPPSAANSLPNTRSDSWVGAIVTVDADRAAQSTPLPPPCWRRTWPSWVFAPAARSRAAQPTPDSRTPRHRGPAPASPSSDATSTTPRLSLRVNLGESARELGEWGGGRVGWGLIVYGGIVER